MRRPGIPSIPCGRAISICRRSISKAALAVLFSILCASAQTITLRGVITDQTGAVVPGAVVVVSSPSSEAQSTSAVTGSDGAYAFAGLRPGSYTVQASAGGLVLARPAHIILKSGSERLNLQLQLAELSEKVTVNDTAGSTVTADP